MPASSVPPDGVGIVVRAPSWGSSQGGDVFFWLTDGPDPGGWPVLGWSRQDATTFSFEGGMAAFLVGLFAGSVDHFGNWKPRGLSWEMDRDWLRRCRG